MLTPTEIPTTSISSPIADIQKEGLMKLANLAWNDNNNVTHAETGRPIATSISSRISAIVSKMQMNEQHAHFQVDGLMELGNLAVNNDNNQEMIAQLGGIARIVSAMNDHPKNAYVQ